MPNGTEDKWLNKVGCEYGRQTRTLLQECKQDFITNISVFDEKSAFFNQRLDEFDKELESMGAKIDKLQAKISWVLGVFAGVGSLVGAILGAVITKAIH